MKHLVNLGAEERQTLLEIVRKGKVKTRKMKRSLVLLIADEGLTDPHIMGPWKPAGPVWKVSANALWKAAWSGR